MPSGIYIRTRPVSKETRHRMSKTHLLNGDGRWMKDKIGENGNNWKGSEVGYQGIHRWLKVQFGKADGCERENCPRQSTTYEWCLKKGLQYERKRENFMQMCRSCHRKYDLDGNTETLGRMSKAAIQTWKLRKETK